MNGTPTYSPGPPPANPQDPVYLQNELRRLSTAFNALALMVPQPADTAPKRPQRGWIRYAVAPWDPLGTGSNVWVHFNGTAWTAL